MNETATGSPVQSVLQEIRRIDGLQAAIERRTRGVAWMAWGLVIPAVFMTYNYVGALYMSGERSVAPAFPFLWVPWVVLGGVMTFAVWRSAGLGLRWQTAVWRGLREFLSFVGVVALLYLVLHFSHSFLGITERVGSGIAMTLIGLAALTMGVTGLGGSPKEDRRFWNVAGVVLLLVGVLGFIAAGDDPDVVLRLYAWLAPTAVGLTCFANGLFLSLRG